MEPDIIREYPKYYDGTEYIYGKMPIITFDRKYMSRKDIALENAALQIVDCDFAKWISGYNWKNGKKVIPDSAEHESCQKHYWRDYRFYMNSPISDFEYSAADNAYLDKMVEYVELQNLAKRISKLDIIEYIYYRPHQDLHGEIRKYGISAGELAKKYFLHDISCSGSFVFNKATNHINERGIATNIICENKICDKCGQDRNFYYFLWLGVTCQI